MDIAICDDNRIFVDELARRIVDYFAKADKECTILKFLSTEALITTDISSAQIIFLDIDMPNINGIETAFMLRNKYPDVHIVFVTNWIEYAPEGYRVNAFRYLLKQKLDSELFPCLDDIRYVLAQTKERIQLQGIDCPLEMTLDDICYIEGSPHRIFKVHLSNQEVVECRGKLADVYEMLSSKGFLRIQKSYIVNMRHLSRIKGYRAILRNGCKLKTSEKEYALICQQYLLWRGQQL